MSPELLLGDMNSGVSNKVDVFAFGVTLWELIHRKRPYPSNWTLIVLFQNVSRGFRPEFAPEFCTPEYEVLKNIIESCWATLPEDRPSFKDVISMLNVNKPKMPQRTSTKPHNARSVEVDSTVNVLVNGVYKSARVMGHNPDGSVAVMLTEATNVTGYSSTDMSNHDESSKNLRSRIGSLPHLLSCNSSQQKRSNRQHTSLPDMDDANWGTASSYMSEEGSVAGLGGANEFNRKNQSKHTLNVSLYDIVPLGEDGKVEFGADRTVRSLALAHARRKVREYHAFGMLGGSTLRVTQKLSKVIPNTLKLVVGEERPLAPPSLAINVNAGMDTSALGEASFDFDDESSQYEFQAKKITGPDGFSITEEGMTPGKNDKRFKTSKQEVAKRGRTWASALLEADHIRASELLEIGDLGAGACGMVVKAVHIPTLVVVALKKVAVSHVNKRGQIMTELEVLKANREEDKYACEYVVSLYDAILSKQGDLTLVMEYLNGGSLEDVIKYGGCDHEPTVAHVAYDILKALQFLHLNEFIHRDVKPGNILLSQQGVAKLSDFGIAKMVGEEGDRMATTFVGTMQYMSPERLRGESYSYSSDIFALGLSLLALVTGRYPIPKKENKHIFSLLAFFKKGVLVEEHEWAYSEEMYHFLKSCLEWEPEERPTAVELLRDHPFPKLDTMVEDQEEDQQGLELTPIGKVDHTPGGVARSTSLQAVPTLQSPIGKSTSSLHSLPALQTPLSTRSMRSTRSMSPSRDRLDSKPQNSPLFAKKHMSLSRLSSLDETTDSIELPAPPLFGTTPEVPEERLVELQLITERVVDHLYFEWIEQEQSRMAELAKATESGSTSEEAYKPDKSVLKSPHLQTGGRKDPFSFAPEESGGKTRVSGEREAQMHISIENMRRLGEQLDVPYSSVYNAFSQQISQFNTALQVKFPQTN